MDIVDYYLNRRVKNSRWDLSERKLQKMLYFSQGYFMSLNGGNVLFNDKFIRCSGGVEITKLRDIFGEFLFNSIDGDMRDLSGDYRRLSDVEREVLDCVWDTYGYMSGKFLEELIFQRESVLGRCIGDLIEVADIFEDFRDNK